MTDRSTNIIRYKDCFWIIGQAYQGVFKNSLGFICSSAFIIIISIGFLLRQSELMESRLNTGHFQMSSLEVFLSVIVSLIGSFLYFNFVVYWLRDSLKAKSHKLYSPIVDIDKSFWKVLGATMLVFLVATAAGISFMIVSFILNLILPKAFATIFIILFMICMMVLFAIFPHRFSLALPLLSLNYQGSIISALKASWAWTTGSTLKLFTLYFLALIPFILILFGAQFFIISPMMTGVNAPHSAHDIIAIMHSPMMISFNVAQTFLSLLSLSILIHVVGQVYLILSGVKPNPRIAES